jgi:hypothetical protein
MVTTKTSSMVAQVEASIQPGELWFGGKSMGPSDLVVVRGTPTSSIRICRIKAGQSSSSESCETFVPKSEAVLSSEDWRSKSTDGLQVSAPYDDSIATSTDRIYIGYSNLGSAKFYWQGVSQSSREFVSLFKEENSYYMSVCRYFAADGRIRTCEVLNGLTLEALASF